MIRIDPDADVAPFEQVRAGFTAAIASGEMAPGTRLPTVRALADELGIAPGTVARAYRELETAGLLETRGRAGTFVAFSADPAREQAERAAVAFVDQTRALGLDAAATLALVQAVLRR